MASDTAPAAVPGPNENSTTPASPPAPAPGGLAGMLTPVEPARPATFNLHPETPAQDADGTTPAEGASSAAYHDPDQPENTKNGTGNTSRQERSIIRAWMLAGAERWKKGADARNKRLDMKKARHQANQIKETRTVTVNRSGGVLENSSTRKNSASGGGNGSAGKSLNRKSSGGNSANGPKNTSNGSRNGSSGRSGGSGGSGGGSGAGGGRGQSNGSSSGSRSLGTDKPKKHRGPSEQTHGVRHGGDLKDRPSKTDRTKTSKDHAPKASGGGTKSPAGGTANSGKTGKDGAQGPAGGTGKTTPTQTSGKHGTGTTNPAKTSGTPTSGTGPYKVHSPGSNSGRPWKTDKTSSGTKPSDSRDKNTNTGPQKNAGKADLTKKPGKKDPAAQAPAKDPGTTPGKTLKTPPAPRNGKRLNTQPSREAGYRDGTRAAKTVAHVEAWRDGYRDGWTDTKKAAAHEKTRLDKAHADRTSTRTNPEDKPVTQPASSADYHPPTPPKPDHAPGPQPVQVTGIDATRIQLGAGAARPDISRGEVRRLRDFQQRLQAKTDTMTRVGDATRVLEQHAQAQAKQITRLLEQARGVQGGDKLVAALTKLQEAARAQVGKAAEIRTRAARATEACKALVANTETRYGGIYQAVVDSPETSPAEMRYYREMETAGV